MSKVNLMRNTVTCALFAATALAQPAVFESASIKKAGVALPGIHANSDSLTMHSVTLAQCIAWAYRVQNFQIDGLKEADEHYDISATAGRAASEDELRSMLKALLADRFHLALHHELNSITIYALIPGRNLHVEKSEGEFDDFSVRGQHMTVLFEHITLREFADLLSLRFKTPVVDSTGLAGRFNLKLDPSRYMNGDPEVDDIHGEEAALFMAIEDQLGLMFDHRKESVDMLVIDRVGKPGEN